MYSCTDKIDTEIQRSKGMSKVSKGHTGLRIQSYVTHVKGVESSSLYTIRAVMPCMSKVLKEAQNGLIFNQFSICKKFWKAET